MLYNDPKTFREDMLKGYVAAYPDYVVEVPGGGGRAPPKTRGPRHPKNRGGGRPPPPGGGRNRVGGM